MFLLGSLVFLCRIDLQGGKVVIVDREEAIKKYDDEEKSGITSADGKEDRGAMLDFSVLSGTDFVDRPKGMGFREAQKSLQENSSASHERLC